MILSDEEDWSGSDKGSGSDHVEQAETTQVDTDASVYPKDPDVEGDQPTQVFPLQLGASLDSR